MRLKAWLMMAALALPGLAQDGRTQAIFDLKYGEPGTITALLMVFPNCGINFNQEMHTISVCANSAAGLKTIEETIRRYDVYKPAENIEFTIYLLIASPDPAKSGPVPAALESVMKQMTATFALKGYRLFDTLVLRARDSRPAEVSAIAPTRGVDGQQMFYQSKIKSARIIPDDKGKNIRIDGLRVGLRVPYRSAPGQGSPGGTGAQYQYAEIGFNTDIDVREGQKAVVGKANLDGNETMFAVLVPKIVE
ncbi:MAG: hypothetical protein NTZ56_18900 [Acidobacteria bacterium]|nr:hypothetical protein [Acidobacteriota bacterium]